MKVDMNSPAGPNQFLNKRGVKPVCTMCQGKDFNWGDAVSVPVDNASRVAKYQEIFCAQCQHVVLFKMA